MTLRLWPAIALLMSMASWGAHAAPPEPALVELGRHLFFDTRLSGDMGLSCASCHDPRHGWADGLPLARGYTGSGYFRNAPSLVNVGRRKRLMWDGRLDGADLATAVRDMVTEAHFMNADARLVQERVKQSPEYRALWARAFGARSEPYGPRLFDAVGAFLKTLQSNEAPVDRGLSGAARAGQALFNGKAGCVRCHGGPMFSDGDLHRTGVPEHPQLWRDPLRSITLLRHYATQGMPNYMNARSDVGAYAVSKREADRGRFATPSLRELRHTAPYMHNGVFATLDEVIDFYDRAGGPGSELNALHLSTLEKQQLRSFLDSLSGAPIVVTIPRQPEFRVLHEDGIAVQAPVPSDAPGRAVVSCAIGHLAAGAGPARQPDVGAEGRTGPHAVLRPTPVGGSQHPLFNLPPAPARLVGQATEIAWLPRYLALAKRAERSQRGLFRQVQLGRRGCHARAPGGRRGRGCGHRQR